MWNILNWIIFASCIFTFRISKIHQLWSSFWNRHDEINNYYWKCYLSSSAQNATAVTNNRHCCHHEVKTKKEIEANNKIILAHIAVRIDLMSSLNAQSVVITVFNKLYHDWTLKNTYNHKQKDSRHLLSKFLLYILDIPVIQ